MRFILCFLLSSFSLIPAAHAQLFESAKREKLLSKITFGAGIDLYYLSIDYAWLDYVNDYSAENYSYELGHHLQLTARIPLDGYKPDSILHHLFNY